MKKILKNVVLGAVLIAMIFSMMPASFSLAAKGTHDGSCIELNDPTKDSWNIIYNTQDDEFSKVSGVTYDEKTNTLTLSKYVNSNAELRVNEIGDDFKIKISGNNEIKSINAEGNTWGCSIEISGSGTLTVNKKQEAENAIRIYGKCISNFLKVKEGVILKAYKMNDDRPSIQVEGKNKNTISISGISSMEYKEEGPMEQSENVPVLIPKTCLESTYVDYEGDNNQYAVIRDGDGYVIFRKTQETVQGYPVYENTYIWRHADDMSGKVKEDATIDAIILDYDIRDADLFANSGDSGYDGLYYNWDENYFAYCKLTKILDTETYLATDLEQINNPNEIPEGWQFQVVGNNYATQYWGDFSMIGMAKITKKTAKKSGLSVSWAAVSGATGYEVRYSTSSKMKNAWTQELAASKKSVTIESLKSKVKIYVQVRAFSTNENGVKRYGAWSKAINVKTK